MVRGGAAGLLPQPFYRPCHPAAVCHLPRHGCAENCAGRRHDQAGQMDTQSDKGITKTAVDLHSGLLFRIRSPPVPVTVLVSAS